ncbi:MAG: SGNH/GDSL hydrolase family protein [Byssovorax sp.]
MRVIPPSAGPPIFAALGSPGAAFTLVSARIDRDAVWASLCRAADPTRCFAIQLDDPQKGCEATRAGPWCVSFPDGAPPEEARAPLLKAFGSLKDEAIWQEADAAPRAAPPRAEAAPSRADEPHVVAHPGALAAAVVVAPILIGLAVGRALRSRRTARPAARAALALTPIVAAYLLLPIFARVGGWDVLLAGLLVGVSALAGSSRESGRSLGRKLGLAAVATALALAVVELGARRLPAPHTVFPAPGAARLLFDDVPGIEACAPFYPASTPGPFLDRTRGIRPGAPIVIHLGDSMVEGVGVAPGETFVARLGELEPGVNNVNAGFASTSADAQLLLIRGWLDRLAAARVVLYVFGTNDLAEIDRPYPCCPGGPLLDASREARARCASPGRLARRRDRLAASPAPYPLRVATGASTLARHAVVAFARVGGSLGAPAAEGAPDPDARFVRFAAVVGAMRREIAGRGVAFTLAYLPARASLEAAAPKETGDYAVRGRVADLARELGVPMLDPWEMLEAAVRRDGAARYYFAPPDIHFTPEGHRVVAAWIDHELPAPR